MEARVTKLARVRQGSRNPWRHAGFARTRRRCARLAARQHDEAPRVVAPLDDLHAQRRHLCHRSVDLPGVVAAIGPDQFEPREAAAYLVEDESGPVAVLYRGGVD